MAGVSPDYDAARLSLFGGSRPASSDSVRVWLEDWSFQEASGGRFLLTLHVQEGEVAIQLRLTSAKPLVRQGEQDSSPLS